MSNYFKKNELYNLFSWVIITQNDVISRGKNFFEFDKNYIVIQLIKISHIGTYFFSQILNNCKFHSN